MIVVSDTTPLNYLVLVEAIDVLPKLFERVYVPVAVLEELTRSSTPPAVSTWAATPPVWLAVATPKAKHPETSILHAGEADAISLAVELNIDDILIDERRGRRIAHQLGLYPLPTLAVLEKAAAEDLIDLPLIVDRLRETSFRVSDTQLAQALERNAARKRLS